MYTIRVSAILLLAAATESAAQSSIGRTTPGAGPPVATTGTMAAPPRIDGRLDEEAWQRARTIEGFTQREPRQGDDVSERTVVRILTDKDALYAILDRADRAAEP